MILKKPEYKWYAVYTKINSEKKILERLKEQEIISYLPLRKSLKQWSDRKQWIEEPLFRSYIFVKVSHLEFFDVLSIPGTVKYVSFGGRAQSIPEYQIENIKAFVQHEEAEIVLTKELVEKGVKVEVLHGPLKGVKGEIIKRFGQYRILIRVDAMGCILHTNISKEEVKFLNNQDLRYQK